MILGIRNNARHCWTLVILISFLALAAETHRAGAEESKRVLILPFHVSPEHDNKELRSFAMHVDKKIRSIVGQLGGGVRMDDEETTARLLRGREAPSTDEGARAVAEESDADLVIYGVISNEKSRYRMRGVMWDHSQRQGGVLPRI